MKKMILLYFFIIVSFLTYSQNSNWVNVKYIDRTKNILPCECEDNTLECFYITIINNGSHNHDDIDVVLNYIHQTEPHHYKVVEFDSLYYKIEGYNKNWEIVMSEIQIKGDTLSLIEKGLISNFIMSESESSNEYDSPVEEGISLLNKALWQRGYPSIEKIIGTDNLGFSCNSWWNSGLNILYKKDETKLWILSIKDGYLYIDNILNPFKTPFDPIKKKLVKKIRWDSIRQSSRSRNE